MKVGLERKEIYNHKKVPKQAMKVGLERKETYSTIPKEIHDRCQDWFKKATISFTTRR